MATNTQLQSDAAIPPGLFLADVLEDMGMSQADLSRRMGRPAQAINEIIAGRKALTAQTALQLEQVLGIPAHIWNNLESQYRLALARRRDEQDDLADDLEILSRVNFYPFLVKSGQVEQSRSPRIRVQELRNFFAVTELVNIEKSYSTAFRLTQTQRSGNSALTLACWLRSAELKLESRLRDAELPAYEPEQLSRTMQSIRRHTLNELDTVLARVHSELQASGVQLVLQESIPGCGMCGAAFWWRKRIPVAVVSDHGKTEDRFWFNLLHELSHILLHGNDRVFVDLDNIGDSTATAQMEEEADELAMSCLISQDEYDAVSWQSDYPTDREIELAVAKIGVHAGIVAGRLCREEEISWNRAAKFCRKFRLPPLSG